MKPEEIFSIFIKALFFIPFMVLFIIFVGCSTLMKQMEGMNMKGKGFARAVIGGFAVISMIMVQYMGKVYE